jgi:hypothetical protein
VGFEIVRVRLRNTTYCGKTNILTDSLSRRPDYMEGKIEPPEKELFKYEDDKIVQNPNIPEAICTQILQVQEKDTFKE